MSDLENLKYELQEDARPAARIKVVGVGGGGSNAAAHIMGAGLEGIEFYVLNTDVQALQSSPVPNKLAIGCKVTQGRGAGADPEVGRQAALEDTARIIEILEGADMVFVTAGLGSGTGTGAAPVVASLAKELNALTIAVVTKPFAFEGTRRMMQAEEGLAKLTTTVDTVIAVPNERLLALAPRGTSFLDAFRMGHEFLRQTVQDIVEIMTTPGFINRDFSDVRAAMVGMGYAMLGTATARGDNAVVEAARQAIGSPLLEDAGIKGAQNLLINITGSGRVGLHEVNEACMLIRQATGCQDVQVNFGIVFNESMADGVKVTVIATGFGRREAEPEPAREPAREPASERIDDAPTTQTEWLSEVVPEPAPPDVPVREKVPPEPEPVEDLDDLDTPAFMRQRRVRR